MSNDDDRFFGANESFKDPTVSYPLEEDPKKPVLLKNVDKLDKTLLKTGVRFHPLVHIVRHPLTHIETTSRCICAKVSVQVLVIVQPHCAV